MGYHRFSRLPNKSSSFQLMFGLSIDICINFSVFKIFKLFFGFPRLVSVSPSPMTDDPTHAVHANSSLIIIKYISIKLFQVRNTIKQFCLYKQ